MMTIVDITEQFGFLSDEVVKLISIKNSSNILLTSYGRVFVWGANNNGILGEGSTTDIYQPVEITSKFSLTNDDFIISLSTSSWYSIAISKNGKIFTWGNTNYGELGNGVKVDTKTSPIDITSNFSFDEGDFPVNVISSVGQYVLTNNKNYMGLD